MPLNQIRFGGTKPCQLSNLNKTKKYHESPLSKKYPKMPILKNTMKALNYKNLIKFIQIQINKYYQKLFSTKILNQKRPSKGKSGQTYIGASMLGYMLQEKIT
jgi:hypothetical protein